MPHTPDHATVPVLAAVISRDGRTLLAKRPRAKRHGGLWEFPGGKLEPGESWLDAATRELREELGVDVTAAGEPVFRQRDPASEFEIVFVEVAIRGEPQALEHDDVRWVTAADLAALELAPADAAFAARLGPGWAGFRGPPQTPGPGPRSRPGAAESDHG